MESRSNMWSMRGIIILLSFLSSVNVYSQDILSSATVYNSPGDIGSWQITATITNIHFDTLSDGSYINVDFDRRVGSNRWPDYPWGSPGDSLQYSLGICLFLSSNISCSAPIQFWYGRDTHATTNLSNWFYDSRWDGMTNAIVKTGDTVGIF